MDLILRN
jgi:hypothetical protein